MVKNLPANTEDTGEVGSIPAVRKIPGGGNGNPLPYYCQENPTDRGSWWVTVHGVAKSQIRRSDLAGTHDPLCYLLIRLFRTAMAQTLTKLPAMQEAQVQPQGQEDPLENDVQPTSIFLPRKSHGQRILVGYSPWSCKESDMT